MVYFHRKQKLFGKPNTIWKKALPVKDEEIIKDKPAGEEVEEIQRKSIVLYRRPEVPLFRVKPVP